MMQPHIDIFCSRSGAVVCGNLYADYVVFKCSTSDFGSIGVDA